MGAGRERPPPTADSPVEIAVGDSALTLKVAGRDVLVEIHRSGRSLEVTGVTIAGVRPFAGAALTTNYVFASDAGVWKIFRHPGDGSNREVAVLRHLGYLDRGYAPRLRDVGSLRMPGNTVAVATAMTWLGRGQNLGAYLSRRRTLVPLSRFMDEARTRLELSGRLLARLHHDLAEPSPYQPSTTSGAALLDYFAEVTEEFMSAASGAHDAVLDAARLRASGVHRAVLSRKRAIAPRFFHPGHGDFHLEQVVIGDSGLLVTDFEGQHARRLGRPAFTVAIREYDLACLWTSLAHFIAGNALPASLHTPLFRSALDGYGRERPVGDTTFDIGLVGALRLCRLMSEAVHLRFTQRWTRHQALQLLVTTPVTFWEL